MIITITNQKGGVGKSTLTQNIGAGLAKSGFKTLLIDLDAQGNLTLASTKETPNKTIYEALKEQKVTSDYIININKKLDLIPANINLSVADLEFQEVGKEYRLREAIQAIKKNYDFILIDTPPTLGLLTLNALTACDYVIIPACADLYSIQAISQLAKTINSIKNYTNKKLKVLGVIITRINNTTLTKELMASIEKLTKGVTKVFNTKIREAVAIKEAQVKRQDIFTYAPKHKVADDFNNLVKEIIKGVKK